MPRIYCEIVIPESIIKNKDVKGDLVKAGSQLSRQDHPAESNQVKLDDETKNVPKNSSIISERERIKAKRKKTGTP